MAHVVHSTAEQVGLQVAVGVEQGVLELGTHFFINLESRPIAAILVHAGRVAEEGVATYGQQKPIAHCSLDTQLPH